LRNIDWTAKSQRAFKRLIRKSPQLRPLIEKTLRQLAEDPYHPSLRTHKLVGDLSDIWACSVDYNYRILFDFVQKSDSDLDAILLLNIGSHDEVY
jgi:addiction module RelE/StbE family toxin